MKEIFAIKGYETIEKDNIKDMLELAKRWPGSWTDISIHVKSDIHKVASHAISIYSAPSGKFKFYDSNRKKRLPEITDSEQNNKFHHYCSKKRICDNKF